MAGVRVSVISWECPSCKRAVVAIEDTMKLLHEQPECELFEKSTSEEYTAAVLTSLRRDNN